LAVRLNNLTPIFLIINMEDVMRKCIFLCSLLFLLATVIIVANKNISTVDQNQIFNSAINTNNINSLITEVPEVASAQIVEQFVINNLDEVDNVTNYAITFSNNTGYSWATTNMHVATSNITDQTPIINEENLNNSSKKANTQGNKTMGIGFDTINEFETINLVYSNLNKVELPINISGNGLVLI